jgi:hypothetical protein
MTLQKTGPISASDFKEEFFDIDPVKLSNYYGRTGTGTGDNTAPWVYGVDTFQWPSPFPDIRSRRNVGLVQSGPISYSDLYGRQRYLSFDTDIGAVQNYNWVSPRTTAYTRFYRCIRTFTITAEFVDIALEINGHIRGDYTEPGTYQNTEISGVRNPRFEFIADGPAEGYASHTVPPGTILFSDEENIVNETDRFTTPFQLSANYIDYNIGATNNYSLVMSLEQSNVNRTAGWSGGIAWDAFTVEIRS